MKIYDIIQELNSNNSRLFKESVLLREKNNDSLQSVIYYALNPLKQFHIRKIPKYFPTKEQINFLPDTIRKLDRLSDREFTGNEGVAFLKSLLEGLDEDNAKVIELIIAKDLKCGVSTATVNKIWPNLIPEYPCMLASTYDKKLVDKINWPAIVQLKSDGMRCNIHYKNGSCVYYTRNGKVLDVMNVFDNDIKSLYEKSSLIESFKGGIVFDGELMVMDYDTNDFMSRKEGNGIITKCQRGTLSKEESNRLRFIVWDWIPINNFENSVKFEFPYKKRFDKLDDGIDYSSDKVRVIPSRLVNDIEEAIEIYNDYIKSGNEGIILKDSNSVWENKRSKSHIKFKNELDMDLKVVGVQEGLGKYSGLVGSLICESGCGKVKVNVGSGLTDLDRKYLQENSPIGKIVAVKYNEIISDSNGDKSLFLPIFIEIREDKNIADIIK